MAKRNNSVVSFRVRQAKETLASSMREALGDGMKWLPEYDKVAEWLANNMGQGIALAGDCGRGKSVLLTQVIPGILSAGPNTGAASGYHVSVYHVGEIGDRLSEIKEQKIVAIDEVGSEGEYVSFGNRMKPVAEIADIAERQNKLLMYSTNLTSQQLADKYGQRAAERLMKMCRWIDFRGESMRTAASPTARPLTSPEPAEERPTDRQDWEKGWLIVAKRLGVSPQECEARFKDERRKLADEIRSGQTQVTSGQYVFTQNGMLGHLDGKSVTHIALNRMGLEDGQVRNIGQELEQYRVRLKGSERRAQSR